MCAAPAIQNSLNATLAAESRDAVCILLALHQGADYLQEQLDSYAHQTHKNWRLIASDDGSTDGTGFIFRRFIKSQPGKQITLRKGPCAGFVRNFLSLLAIAPESSDFFAFSDQDDVWFQNKLSRAVNRLAQISAQTPAIYFARTLICDAEKTPLGISPERKFPPGFRNALVQSIGGGNTMVLNKAAAALAKTHLPEQDPVSHDWWLYQLVTGCGGLALFDPQPVLFYRQHMDNKIGSNMGLFAKITRLHLVFTGRYRAFNESNIRALKTVYPALSSDARQTLSAFCAARQGPLLLRLRGLRASGVFRQNVSESLAMIAFCLLKRL